MHRLTKSDFIQYLNCPNELWLRKNKKDLFPYTISPETDFLSEQGYLIQEYAEKMIMETVDIDYRNEVAADYKNLYVRADIVMDKYDSIDIYEVKSATSFKEQYLYDLAFQKYVFEKSGKKVDNLYLIHINNEYIKNGALDYLQLFAIKDLTAQVNEILDEVEAIIKKINKFINGPIPEIVLRDSCSERKNCPFISHFFPELPDYSVFDISRLSKKNVNELLSQNIIDIKDVPADYILSEKQRIQVKVAKLNKPLINREAIRKTLDNLQYPLYFIDYESINFGVPEYENYRPYQQAVFQYSLFIKKTPKGKLIHKEFIASGDSDPALEVLESMSEHIKPGKGTFIVWNQSFEMQRNNEMAKLYPKYSNLLKQFNDNVFDLMTIFSKQLYIHPKFKGKVSLKKVLPVFMHENCYNDLDIDNGQLASVMWVKLIRNGLSEKEKKKIKKDLLKYCKMDTLGMVKIFEGLKQKSRKPSKKVNPFLTLNA